LFSLLIAPGHHEATAHWLRVRWVTEPFPQCELALDGFGLQ